MGTNNDKIMGHSLGGPYCIGINLIKVMRFFNNIRRR